MSIRTNQKTIIIILATLIFAISSLFLLRNIYDPDFFWHIKTGEWIWQHKSFPSVDPFAYTSPGHHTSREHFILTSFWLSQVTYHLFYLAGGLAGIALLRFLIAGALLYAMWKRKHGDNIIYMGLLLIFLTCFLKQFPIERPQVFSFLFFAVLLYMLEILKGKSHRSPGRLIITYPSDWKAGLYITKGDLYISQGNVSMAVEAYEKAVEIVPFNITARERLNHLGRTDE